MRLIWSQFPFSLYFKCVFIVFAWFIIPRCNSYIPYQKKKSVMCFVKSRLVFVTFVVTYLHFIMEQYTAHFEIFFFFLINKTET